MPIFFVLGMGLLVITVAWIFLHTVFYGTKRDLIILFAAAWVIVIVLWVVQI